VEVSGQRFRLKRPLDWAAVTDQADAPGHQHPTAQELRGLRTMEERERWFLNFARRNRSGKPEHLPFWQGSASTAAAWSSLIWFTPRA
jgi:hypothetical protein